MEEIAFLRQLQPLIANAYATPEIEELEVKVESGTKELVKGGVVYLETQPSSAFR